MHHDRRPAALILLGVTETDALHLPVLVTNLKCALECSWQDPARLHPGPGGLVLADAAALLQSKNGSKSHGPTGPSSHLVSRYLALAAATSLGPTPSGLPVFLPRASRLVSRIGRHRSRLVRRGDDTDTRLPSSQCMRAPRAGACRRSRWLPNALFLDS